MSCSPSNIFFQQRDLDTLLVAEYTEQSRNPDWTILKDRIAEACYNRPEDLYNHKHVPQIAIVQFEHPVKDLRKCQRNLKKRECNLTLTPFDEPSGIVVINSKDFDPEVIHCYTLLKQSGIGQNNNPKVNVHSGITSVTFLNTEAVLPKVLGRTHTLFDSSNLYMEPYFPSFHDAVARVMLDQNEDSTDTSVSSESDLSSSEEQLETDGYHGKYSSDEECEYDQSHPPGNWINRSLSERTKHSKKWSETEFDDEEPTRKANYEKECKINRSKGDHRGNGKRFDDIETRYDSGKTKLKTVNTRERDPGELSLSTSSDSDDNSYGERRTKFQSKTCDIEDTQDSEGNSVSEDGASALNKGIDQHDEIDLDEICTGEEEKKVLAACMKAKCGQKFVEEFQNQHHCKINVKFLKKEIKQRTDDAVSQINTKQRSSRTSDPAPPQARAAASLPRSSNKDLGRQFVLFVDDDDDDDDGDGLNIFFPGLLHTSSSQRSRQLHPKTRPKTCLVPAKIICGNPRSESIKVNKVKITVKKGDASQEKADVLVNVVSTKLQLTESIISKTYAAAGGQVIHQEFDRAKTSYDGNGVIVTRGGNLECHYLYTLVLDIRRDNTSDNKYAEILQQCFAMARKANVSSIALPMVGCGRLLQYLPNMVAEILVKKSIAAAQENGTSFQYITLIAFEDAHYDLVKKTLHTEDAALTAKRSHHRKAESCKEIVGCTISVSGVTHDLPRIKTRLERSLKDAFLAKETMRIPNRDGISNRLKGKIFEYAYVRGTNPVIIDIDSRRGEVSLIGEHRQITRGCKDVKTLVENPFPALVNLIHRPLCCTPDSWHYMAHDVVQSPPYWKHFSKNCPLSSLSKSAGSERFAVVQVDKVTEKAIKTLLRKTWKTELVGQGKDALDLNHRRIRVEKVERIENLDVFSKYALKRQEHFRILSQERNKTLVPLNKIPVRNKGQIMTMEVLPDALKDDLFPEINESYVFHGTKPEIVKTIIRQGLDCRMGSVKGMFGSGIYGAESSTKADQYADSRCGRTHGQKQMILMRLLMGNMYVCSDMNPTKYRRPPCRHPRCLRDDCTSNHDTFDSVVGDGHWLFREFVVYAAEQCYPEYIITYQRE